MKQYIILIPQKTYTCQKSLPAIHKSSRKSFHDAAATVSGAHRRWVPLAGPPRTLPIRHRARGLPNPRPQPAGIHREQGGDVVSPDLTPANVVQPSRKRLQLPLFADRPFDRSPTPPKTPSPVRLHSPPVLVLEPKPAVPAERLHPTPADEQQLHAATAAPEEAHPFAAGDEALVLQQPDFGQARQPRAERLAAEPAPGVPAAEHLPPEHELPVQPEPEPDPPAELAAPAGAGAEQRAPAATVAPEEPVAEGRRARVRVARLHQAPVADGSADHHRHRGPGQSHRSRPLDRPGDGTHVLAAAGGRLPYERALHNQVDQREGT